MITYDDFIKLEIKIGTIIAVEKHPNADRLLKLTIDLGDEKRQILAGIAEFFPDYAQLIDRQVPVLVNLEPRVMRGEVSNGMMLAADVDGKPFFLHPAEKIPNGSNVK